jgi:hypothetical protein
MPVCKGFSARFFSAVYLHHLNQQEYKLILFMKWIMDGRNIFSSVEGRRKPIKLELFYFY